MPRELTMQTNRHSDGKLLQSIVLISPKNIRYLMNFFLTRGIPIKLGNVVNFDAVALTRANSCLVFFFSPSSLLDRSL